jgi:hypothetical protein
MLLLQEEHGESPIIPRVALEPCARLDSARLEAQGPTA